jgi:hypothetical protein
MQGFHIILEGGNAMFATYSSLRHLGLFALLTAGLFAISFDAAASPDPQPPAKKGKGDKGKGDKGPPADADILTVRGMVKDFTTAPKGEKDGVILTDGTWAHWPPYLENRFSTIVDRGDKVKVIGWMETGKKGESKLEVSSLTNLNTGQTRENDRFPPDVIERRAGSSSAFGGAVTANGSVREFTTAKKGEVDGFKLSDGQWVHWPPQQSSRFADFVVKGDKVRVTGFKETDKKGETKLEVSTLTNLRTNKTVENPERPIPAAGLPIQGTAVDRDARIRALEDQVEQLLLELKRLRKDK